MKMHSAGYVWTDDHQLEHVAVAEKALGRKLPPKAVVHHVNHNRADNRPTNLVICPNAKYHHLLHMRERAIDACGDPTKRKCVYCKEWDDPSSMSVRDKGIKGTEYRHRACHAANQLARNRRKLTPDGITE